MTAPNLKSPTTITGKTARYDVTASIAAALSNASSSGKALKINTKHFIYILFYLSYKIYVI